MSGTRVRSLTVSALLVALLAVSAWVTLPLGAVPATLQTFVVVLIALVCRPVQAAVTVGVYLLAGAAGVPVFSNAQGGLAALVGPTGGYLLGFWLGAVTGASVARPAPRRVPSAAGDSRRGTLRDAAAAAVTLACVYTLGALWLAFSTGRPPVEAVAVGVVPFLPLDAAKGAAAVAAAAALRRGGVA